MFTLGAIMTAAELSQKEVKIHPSAMVEKGAQLGTGVEIGPGAIVGQRAILGDGVKIGASAIISGRTTIGKSTVIFPHATIGSPPQDLKYSGEDTELVIGERNQIREYVNISLGTVGGGGKTTVGDHNLIMVYSHIAHDCHVGNECILANGVHLAGHVTVHNNVVFGGMSGGHQFCHFGERVMVAAGSIVVQDVPPYCMVQGDRATVQGLNVVGLRRAGVSSDEMTQIKKMFQIVFQQNLTLEDAIDKIRTNVPESVYQTKFLEFLKTSTRGICR